MFFNVCSLVYSRNKWGETTDWWCSLLNQQIRCPATVRQKGDDFIPGNMNHTHAEEPGIASKFEITTKVSFNTAELSLIIILRDTILDKKRVYCCYYNMQHYFCCFRSKVQRRPTSSERQLNS